VAALFRDREAAGVALAKKLQEFRDRDVVVLGLPRGGVPVAAVVASELGKPLDIIGVRKLGVPGQEELAMGAIGEGGVRVFNDALLQHLDIGEEDIVRVEALQQDVLAERLALFRSGRPEVSLAGKIALVVDDGLATGATARAACLVARAKGATRVVLAVPVAPREESVSFPGADQIVVVSTPEPFIGVGRHYEVFDQTSDEDVRAALAKPTTGDTGQSS
jgi:putative phosphoribosyl transferase